MSEEIIPEIQVPPEKIEKFRETYKKYLESSNNIGVIKFIKKMTFDDFCIWYYKRELKSSAKNNARKGTKIKRNQPKPAPPIRPIHEIKSDQTFELMVADEKYVPTADQFYQFAILFQSAPIDRIRVTKFASVPNEVWNRFIKQFYNFYHANPEQVAMDLRKVREISMHALSHQIETLTTLQKESEKSSEKADLAKTIGVLTNQLSNISSQFARDLSSLGLVGSKVRGGINIQIVNKIPRPTAFNPKKNPTIQTIAPEIEDIELV